MYVGILLMRCDVYVVWNFCFVLFCIIGVFVVSFGVDVNIINVRDSIINMFMIFFIFNMFISRYLISLDY